MADTTVSLIAGGGGDYTTLTSAVAMINVSGGNYIVEIGDTSVYSELNLLIPQASITGTPSRTNALWITTAPAFRHNGTIGSGAVIETQVTIGFNDFAFRTDWTEWRCKAGNQTIIGTSVNSAYVGCWLMASHCLFDGRNDTFTLGAIKTEYWQIDTYVDNCVFVACQVGSFGATNYYAPRAAYTAAQHTRIDYCSQWSLAGTSLGQNVFDNGCNVNGVNGTVHADIYNSVFTIPAAHTGQFAIYVNGGCVFAGSNNANDGVITNVAALAPWFDGTPGHVTDGITAVNAIMYADIASAHGENLAPQQGQPYNVLLGNAVNRVGLEPEPFQDFSVDVTGARRSATDPQAIGAYAVAPPRVHRRFGGAWVTV